MRRVKELSDQHRGQTLVLVSHTALNRLILLSVLGLDAGGFWKIRQDTCAINAFEMENGLSTLSLLNETSHLVSVNKAVGRGDSKTI